MLKIFCANCRAPFPDQGCPYRCVICGGYYDCDSFPVANFAELFKNDRKRSTWRFRDCLGLSELTDPISLGEGHTPLILLEVSGRKVFFKNEALNPTGSVKDRGSTILASFLALKQVEEVVEESSGNAGVSLAAYTALGGIKTRIFLPSSTEERKIQRIRAYGAQVFLVEGPPSTVAETVREEAGRGVVYASHAYLPFNMIGYLTIAFELYEELGTAPGAIIAPAGHGNLLTGIGRGFQSLEKAGMIDRLPVLVGAQARACAPLWAVNQYGSAGVGWTSEGETMAEGIRVKYPVRGDAVLQIVNESKGTVVAVDEEDIINGRDEMAGHGLYVEPTSAIVWNALHQVIADVDDPVVVILTGMGS